MPSPSWLVRLTPRSRASTTLVCFPHAGGGAAVYGRWTRTFPADIDLYAVQMPGREARMNEPVPATMAEVLPPLTTSRQSPAGR